MERFESAKLELNYWKDGAEKATAETLGDLKDGATGEQLYQVADALMSLAENCELSHVATVTRARFER
ncbi:hypothetical protein QUW13_04940 [Enterococcus hirae]|jgi:hypothetical protein|nr:hypothetical protein [Enterococcaceae bacterium]MCI1919020.1 hypothetical protein [Enterococcaceae bacterium]MDM8213215.1 hypothetical protein [Enterococcus hirae]